MWLPLLLLLLILQLDQQKLLIYYLLSLKQTQNPFKSHIVMLKLNYDNSVEKFVETKITIITTTRYIHIIIIIKIDKLIYIYIYLALLQNLGLEQKTIISEIIMSVLLFSFFSFIIIARFEKYFNLIWLLLFRILIYNKYIYMYIHFESQSHKYHWY